MRWTEYEKKNKVAVCLSLLWRKSRQNGTGNSHPEEEERRKVKKRTEKIRRKTR